MRLHIFSYISWSFVVFLEEMSVQALHPLFIWIVCLFGVEFYEFFLYFLKRFYLFIYFRERGEGEREGEKHQCVVASHVPCTGDLAHNPGMGPDWESNQRSFGPQAVTQYPEPQQPGLLFYFYFLFLKVPVFHRTM